MAKIRVHELAREIERQSKEIISFLAEKGIEVKNHMATLEDEQAQMVRSVFQKQPVQGKGKEEQNVKKAPAQPEKPALKESAREKEEAGQRTAAQSGPAANENRTAQGSAEKRQEGEAKSQGQEPQKRPVKKKPNIIFVSNPHNSRSGGQGRNGRPGASDKRQVGTIGGPDRRAENRQPADGHRAPAGQRPQTAQQRPAGQAPAQSAQRPAGSQQTAGQHTQNTQRAAGPQQRQGNAQQRQGNAQQRQGTQSAQRPQDRRPQDSRTGADQNRTDNTRNKETAQRNPRSDYGNNRNQRPGDNRGRGARPNDRPDNRFQKPVKTPAFPAEAAAKEPEKHRDDQDRRRKAQEKRRKEEFDREQERKKLKNGKAMKIDKPQEKQAPVKEEEKIKVIVLPETLTIKELAEKMKTQPSVIVKKLFLQGQIVTVNQEISYEQAEEIAIEYDVICEKEEVIDVIEELLKEEEEDEASMTARPPVICVMGHVDHGKTSLLDAIRKTNVTDREAGGITQHIGAYVVNVKNQKITFLDTPGHEAFTAMRMRGANATDIAILVVAADDGVMPQTVEAINHAKAAGIEIIVAVNKIDKPNANIDRVKQELAEYELVPEDWGGSTVFAPVSAKSGEGIEELLEMILLTAEILELKANEKRQARGLVIEAQLDKGRGPVATVLVQKGTLHVGDFIAAGSCHGKVRAMIDDKGKRVREAGPSTPVEILGLNDVPNAGEIFVAPENDKEARNFADTFISQNKEKLLDATKQKMSLDDLFQQIQEGSLKELNLIVKADVQGSVEAVKQSLQKLSNEEVVVKIIHGGVGAINESDVILASASNAIIIGFNVRPDAMAKTTAETEGVDIRLYKVIYQAIEDVEAAMKGMLDPVFEEKVIGHGEIRQIFKASGVGNIAGAYVLDGMFQRNCKVRISREGEQIFEGPLASLKRFKDDVKEVKAGYECGLVFEGFDEIRELDQVEAYIMVEVPR